MSRRMLVSARERGFTLMELAVIIGVIGILFSTVMVMRGYAEGARVTAGVQMIDTLEKAARSWSTRYTNRTGFVTNTGTPISLNALSNAGLVDAGLVSPWNTAPVIGPAQGDTSRIQIDVQTTDPESAIDLESSLRSKGGVSRSGRTVSIITR